MELQFTVLIPHSELRNFLQDVFQTTLTPEEAGRFIYNLEHPINKDIVIKNARRSIKESVAPPETITFAIHVGELVGSGLATKIVVEYLYSKLKIAKWLKIGKTESTLTEDDIRRIIREELERQRKENDSQES